MNSLDYIGAMEKIAEIEKRDGVEEFNVGRFVFDAYLYAEEELTEKRFNRVALDIQNGRDINDEVVENYVIDILSGRCLPMTQKYPKK